MNLFDLNIKDFLKKNMYLHKSVIHKTNFGKRTIKYLFSKIRQNPGKHFNLKEIKKKSIDRTICDFIAGMTDRFAIDLYNKLK